jgi:release factor glutamine methyltransferase
MKPLLEVLTSGTDYLKKRHIEEARLNMEHLIAHVLQCRRMDLYLRFDHLIKDEDLATLRDVLKRRGEGEPLQHLLGTVEFHGQEFISDHRALIPRPETEHLVSLIVERYGKAPPARVLDMATGSGCIGLSLAKAWPQSHVTLVDVSEDALELARLNTTRLNLQDRVRLLRSDLFEKVSGTFDLVVSNLPYIPTAEIKSLSREVRRDPVLALDGGPDGLVIVRRFLHEVPKHLTSDGTIALELGHDQGATVASLCTEAGWQTAQVQSDLAEVPRFVFASTPPVVITPPATSDVEASSALPTTGGDDDSSEQAAHSTDQPDSIVA